MFHFAGLGVVISSQFSQLKPDTRHGLLWLSHDGELDLHVHVDLLRVQLEAGLEVEAGVTGVRVEVTARLAGVDAVEARLLEIGRHGDDGARAEHQNCIGTVCTDNEIYN